MRRAVMSPIFLLVFVGSAIAVMLWLSHELAARGHERAEAESRQTAEVVVAAVVAQHLADHVGTDGRIASEAMLDLRADLDGLRREGLLADLRIWLLDGRPVFAYRGPAAATGALTEAQLDRARSGMPWTAHGQDGAGDVLRVFLPQTAVDTAPVPTVVEVVIPHDAATRAVEEQLERQQWSMLALVALLIGGMFWLRRRLVRRERQARHDSLTGLLNRRALYEDARAVLGRATDRSPAALLLLDLVEFKSVNDTLGHGAGDQLLRQVAATLRDAVRRSDQVVRLGGDEFAILLPDLVDAALAQQLAEQVRVRLRAARFVVSDVELTVDASIGVALAPQHGREMSVLLQHADVAMYQAKRGHGGSVVYDPSSDGHSVDQLALVAELRQALVKEEFRLHYQPKLSLTDGRVGSVEALLRWQHPTRGLLLPADFLPVLEVSGLMSAVTRWVLRQAVHQAARWRTDGMPLQVAVNVGARSLLEQDLPARVLAVLSGADLPASFLQLEITETAVMTDPRRAALVLGQLHARGVGVVIDDFGAGYTSLAHLRTLPVTELKLDRSLVTHMLERPADEAVTRAVIALSHRLGIHVVAEGVETDDVMDRLTEFGCDEVQGYAVSPALTIDDMAGWLALRAPMPQSLISGGALE